MKGRENFEERNEIPPLPFLLSCLPLSLSPSFLHSLPLSFPPSLLLSHPPPFPLSFPPSPPPFSLTLIPSLLPSLPPSSHTQGTFFYSARTLRLMQKYASNTFLPQIYVAVPDRNRILFCRIFQLHHRVQRAIALSFRLGRGSYVLHGRIRYSCGYIACMSPTFSRSSALQRVKLSDALKIRNRTIFNFYPGLPHILFYTSNKMLILKFDTSKVG